MVEGRLADAAVVAEPDDDLLAPVLGILGDRHHRRLVRLRRLEVGLDLASQRLERCRLPQLRRIE